MTTEIQAIEIRAMISFSTPLQYHVEIRQCQTHLLGNEVHNLFAVSSMISNYPAIINSTINHSVQRPTNTGLIIHKKQSD